MTPAQREADLRRRATPSELTLKGMLDAHPATAGRFKFQAHWRGFYLDFLFAKAKLVVEIDGACHSTTAAKIADARRTAKLVKAGFTVVRFWNGELRDEAKVITRILRALGGDLAVLTLALTAAYDRATPPRCILTPGAPLSLDDLPAIRTRGRARGDGTLRSD